MMNFDVKIDFARKLKMNNICGQTNAKNADYALNAFIGQIAAVSNVSCIDMPIMQERGNGLTTTIIRDCGKYIARAEIQQIAA